MGFTRTKVNKILAINAMKYASVFLLFLMAAECSHEEEPSDFGKKIFLEQVLLYISVLFPDLST